MTDINNNMGADKIQHVQNLKFDGLKPASDVQPKNYADKEIKNLDNAHSALVGRSMVKKVKKSDIPNFSGNLADNIKADLAELKANEKTVKQADALFNAAIQKGYSYDKAVVMAREFVNMNKE